MIDVQMCDVPFVPETATSTDTSYFVDRYSCEVDITTSFRASLTRFGDMKNEKDCLNEDLENDCMSEDLKENGSSPDELLTGFDYRNIYSLREINDEQLGNRVKASYEESADLESMSETGVGWNDKHETIQQSCMEHSREDCDLRIPMHDATEVPMDLVSPLSDSENVLSGIHSMVLNVTQREEEVTIPLMNSPRMCRSASVDNRQMDQLQESEKTVVEQHERDSCFVTDSSLPNEHKSSVDPSLEDAQNDLSFVDVKVEEDGEYVNYTVDFQNYRE